jgi:hypothetical protein
MMLPGSPRRYLLTDSGIFASDMPDHYCCHDYRHYVHKVRSWINHPSQSLMCAITRRQRLLTRLEYQSASNIDIPAIT